MIETLETCIRTADFRPLRDVYDAASRLEAFLPIGTMVRKDRNEIIDLFTEWWPSKGTIVHWDTISYQEGFVSGAGAKGWAWNIVNHLDPTRRERDRLELDWWVERARNVMHGVWSPI